MATQNSATNPLVELEKMLDEYLVKKAPFTLPDRWREVIVKFAPYVNLILIILALPALLALFGLGSVMAPFSYLGGLHVGFAYTLGLVVAAVAVVLNALAIPGLFKRSKQGWNYLYYATLVGVIDNVVHFNVGSLIIGSLLSLYILFQVRGYYK
ncbi:MAG: chromate transporter [Patescibacteria group bacterium]|nr:chromate transporter [Patescibacteria group bacterium]